MAAAFALLAVLGASSASAAETKTFSGQKQCHGFIPGTPLTQTCDITKSNLKILLRATVHYTNIVFLATPPATAPDHITSPVTLTAIDTRGSTATGRCTFYFAGPKAGTGHCEWWSGTARLAGFHSRWVVGTVSAKDSVYSLTGPYWFDRDDDDDHGD